MPLKYTIRAQHRPLALAVIVIAISGCAQPYKDIKPEASRTNAFSTLSCSQMRMQHQQINARLEQLAERQKKAVAQDVISVLILGIPTSGGGKNKDIAATKGQEASISQAMAKANCSTS